MIVKLDSTSPRARGVLAAGILVALLPLFLAGPMATAAPDGTAGKSSSPTTSTQGASTSESPIGLSLPAEPKAASPESLAAPSANQTGGPDAFGYTFDDNLSNPPPRCDRFIDISGSGTQLAKGGSAIASLDGGNLDDGFWQVTFPFPFDFYGNNVNGAPLYVATNGLVTFDSAGATSFGGTIPSPTPPNAAVFGFWDDLRLDATNAGVECGTDIDCGIYTQVIGATPNRRFIIQYNQIPFFDQDPDEGHVRFEISFMEATGEMQVDYALELSACAADTCQRVGGSGAKIGIESSDPANVMGTPFTGLSYSTDTVSLLVAPSSSLRSISFHHPSAPPAMCGPDAFGYTFDDNIDHPAHGTLFADISVTGTKLAKGGLAITPMDGGNLDDGFWAVTFPFPFNFYGNDVNGAPLYVGTNGFVTFDSAGATSLIGTIPNPTPPNAAVFGFWDDLRLDATNAGVDCGTDIDCGIYTQVVGTAPNRRFIVQYNQVPFFDQDPGEGNLRFEISFMEATGDIRVDLAPNLTACAADTCQRVRGASASIGLESGDPANASGTPFTGLSYLQDEPFLAFSAGTPVIAVVFHAPSVDLVVTKSESADPVVAGSGAGNLTYVVTVTNSGPSFASGLALSELITVPTGTSIASITPGGGTTYAPANTSPGTWTVGTLPVGASRTLTVVLTVGPSTATGTDTVGDTTTVTATSQRRINTGNDMVTVRTSVNGGVDLMVSKSESSDPVIAGNSLTYTIIVTNSGPAVAANVTVTEQITLPSGASISSITPQSGTTYAPANTSPGTWSIPSIAVGASKTLTVVIAVAASAAAGTDVISDSATVTGATNQILNPGDDSASASTSIIRQVDLRMTKTESVDPVIAGSGAGNLVYVVTLQNLGPSDAGGVVAGEEITFPAHVTLDSVTPQAGTSYTPTNGAIGTWTIGSVPAGATRKLTVTLTADQSADIATNAIADTASVTGVTETLINSSDDTVTEATSIGRNIDLHLSQSESVDPVVAGSGTGNLTYVVTVTNSGPSDASNVRVMSQVFHPAGVTTDSRTPAPPGTLVIFDADRAQWVVGNLAVGATTTYTVVVTAGPSAPAGTDTIRNQAMILPTTPETRTNPFDDNNNTFTSITRAVDLHLTKTESADPVLAGSGAGNLTYVVAISNTGPSDASNVDVSEVITLPTGTTIASITPEAGSTYAPANTTPGTWTIPSLPLGATKVLTVVLTVGSATAVGTDVVGDTASVSSSSEARANPADDAVTVRTSVIRQVDLVVNKTESIDPVVAGSGAGNLTYVVTVANVGPSDASGIGISELITTPSGVNIVSITPQSGTFYAPANASPGTWTISSLPLNASRSLTVVLTAGSSAASGTDVIGDTATITGSNEARVNLINDSVTQRTSIARNVDLVVTKTESIATVVAGSGTGNLTYFITVTNSGPSDASGVTLSEVITLPTGTTIASITAQAGSTYSPANSTPGTWTFASLPAGTSKTLTVVLTVGASTASGTDVIGDTATVTGSTETRSNTGNDAATERTSVIRQVDLKLTKTESIDPVVAGSGAGNLTYVVTLQNLGPSDASNVTVSETINLPAGASIVSIAPVGPATYAPANTSPGTWSVPSLTSGASTTLTVVITVASSAAPGTNTVGDTATVTGSTEARINTGNDTVTEQTTITRRIDLKVTKVESADPILAGSGPGNLTYTVTVQNLGPSDATGVTLSEVITLPTGVTIVSITPQGPTTYAPANSTPGTWTVGNLAPGTSKTLTVVLTVGINAAPGTNTIGDTATVTGSTETRINTGDDSATERTSVQVIAVHVTKTDYPDPVRAGDPLTYTITVFNDSPVTITGPSMVDALPPSTTFSIIAAPAGWSCSGTSTVTCTAASMASGASATFTLAVTVAASAPAGTKINNTATMNSGTGNKTGTATTQSTVYRGR